jgi:hypothetical protein
MGDEVGGYVGVTEILDGLLQGAGNEDALVHASNLQRRAV